MAKMHRVTAGTSPSVEEELFTLFDFVQDEAKVPVGEEDSSP